MPVSAFTRTVPVSVADRIPPQRRAFDQVVSQVAPGRFEVTAAYREHFKLVTPPGMGGTYMTIRAEPDQLYLNEGGRFVMASWPSDRFLNADGAPAEPDESFGLDARFADLNGDGAPDVLTGNIGTEARRQYSISGDVVILASRIEQLNKDFGTQLLVSAEALKDAGESPPEGASLGPVQVKGRDQPIQIYRLV